MKTPRCPAPGARLDGARHPVAAPPPHGTGSKLQARGTRGKRGAKTRAAPAKRKSGQRRPAAANESAAPEDEIKSAEAPSGDPEAAKFVAEFASHWRVHGRAAFDAVAAKDPARYLALAAKLIGRDGESSADGRDLVSLLAGLDRGVPPQEK